MSFPMADRRARILLAGALAAGGLGLAASQAEAAYTPSIQDRVLVVTGDAASDKLTLRAPSRAFVELAVGDDGTADFRIARASFDSIRVLAGDGADTVRIADPNLPPTTVDGQGGADALVLEGSSADEQLQLARDGAGARLSGSAGIDLAGVENIQVATLGGGDSITVDDLTGTGVQGVSADLGTDSAADRLILNGTSAKELVEVVGAGQTHVSGLPALVSIAHADPARDELRINTLAGDDRIAPSGTGMPKLVEDGGDGADNLGGTDDTEVMIGGDGNDFLNGEHGNDVAHGGAGDDIISWKFGDGSDTLDGDGGSDAITLNGASAGEQFRASSVGQRLRITRTQSSASDVLDAGGVERLSVISFGGADTMTFDDLAPAGVASVDATLSDLGTAGDDVFIVNGTAGADRVAALTTGIVTKVTKVTGLATAFSFTGPSALDRLEVNGQAGDDVISTSMPPATMLFRSDGGPGDDVLIGGAGGDVFTGGDGADQVFEGGGDDVAFGGAGDDLLRGDEGDDVLDGGAGTDTLIGGAGEDVLLNGEIKLDD
jgi:Ca2+-binding RTX toxin-like protein